MEDELRAASVTGTLACGGSLERGEIVSKPTIVTSSWYTQLPTADLFSAAPESYARIGISRGVPRGQSGFRMYRKLQPGPGTLKLPATEFTSHYVREVLGRLDAQLTVDELLEMADGRTPALLCFEHTHGPAWCHRALVSFWLWEKLGLEAPELGREQDGCGLDHPKLHPEAHAFLVGE
jgi:hypothetical protein